MKATQASGGDAVDILIKEAIDEIITNNNNAITNNEDYKKYFDSVKVSSYTGAGTEILTIRFIFTPKDTYEMALTEYTLKLDNTGFGNFIEG